MDNLQAILTAYHRSQQKGVDSYLVTVVSTQGSTYRRAGARMLITNQQDLTGMISGGCLEQDILCHIQQRTTPDAFVITYDTTTDEDIVWGFGLGCEGVAQILVERLDTASVGHPLTFIQDCFNRQQPGVLATVFHREEGVPVLIGARLMLDGEGVMSSTLEDAELSMAIAQDARSAIHLQKTTHRHYLLPSGRVDVLIEVIQPPPTLLLFGAGQDALPLAQFTKALGWHLTLVDCRALETTAQRFPMADQIILTRREIVQQQVAIAPQTIAVVMTHNYFDDLEILKYLLPSAAQYIGVLGSRQRTQRLLQMLPEDQSIDQRLHAPIGLDIGAETPEAIAIAIIAEIQAVLAHRTAGFLKHRPAPIHQPFSESLDLTYAAS
jgi:xanthine dehydrogenase accessory factor